MRRYRVWLGRTVKPFSRVVEADDMLVDDQLNLVLYNRPEGNHLIADQKSHTVAIFRPGSWSYVREIQ